ncbi:MAG: hypothetical protein IPK68_14660 [Bdellovibrionales bacterium]|nr:hypothetical protein [Bdellovibrionales bacterium]
MPAKSALSKKRGRVSFEFFKEQVDDGIMKYEPHCPELTRPSGLCHRWRPVRTSRTEDILNQGYRGYPCADDKETHYPRMYVVHCYDVLGGVTKAFRYSNANEEMHNAMEIAVGLEEKSLTLYDRLFFCKDLVRSTKALEATL